jgi:hypothetical protein
VNLAEAKELLPHFGGEILSKRSRADFFLISEGSAGESCTLLVSLAVVSSCFACCYHPPPKVGPPGSDRSVSPRKYCASAPLTGEVYSANPQYPRFRGLTAARVLIIGISAATGTCFAVLAGLSISAMAVRSAAFMSPSIVLAAVAICLRWQAF